MCSLSPGLKQECAWWLGVGVGPVSRRFLGSSREGAQVCRDIREDSAECPGPSSYEGR